MPVQATALGVVSVLTVLVLPGVAVAGGIVAWAWRNGWPATRLRNWTLAVIAAWSFSALVSGDPLAPWSCLQLAMQQAVDGQWPQAVTNAAGAELLVATPAAWWWWHGRTKRMTSGTEQIAGERHMKRQRLNREKDARRRSKREPTPLSRDERVILGHRYEDTYAEVRLAGEQLRQRHQRWISATLERLRLHMAVIAQTGAGKSTLLERLSAGWTEAAWRRYDLQSSQLLPGSPVEQRRQAAPRPLTIFLDAKGGREAGDSAFAWADAMQALGVDRRRVGVFPFENRLNMWRMPAKQLRASLHALAATDNEFYQRLQRGLLHLVIDAPAGPPRSSVEFLKRINTDVLMNLWDGHQVELQTIETLSAGPKGGASPLDTDLMLFDDLFRTLGGDFDAGRPLTDFDALWITVPGSVDSVVASTKAAVVIELLQYELSVNPREVLFILDEFSAVSGDVAGSVTNLVERIRSQGGSVVVSAQSYQGLANSDDERERLLNAMGGGMLVGRTQGAEPLAKRSGTRKTGEAGMKLQGGDFDAAGEGTLRRQDAFLLDPNRVRRMPEHHVAYVLPDHVQWGVVTPLEPTKRLPSDAIAKSPQRALPPAGDAVPYLQLRADQRSTVDEQLRGWSA